MEDANLTYHPTKFGDNWKTQCGNMDKIVENVFITRLQSMDGITWQNTLKYILYCFERRLRHKSNNAIIIINKTHT